MTFLHVPFPFQQVSFLQVSFFQQEGFCNMLVFCLGGFHPGSPLSPLVGRILVTFWYLSALIWLGLGFIFSLCFLDDFW